MGVFDNIRLDQIFEKEKATLKKLGIDEARFFRTNGELALLQIIINQQKQIDQLEKQMIQLDVENLKWWGDL